MQHFFNVGKDNMMYDTQANNIYMLDEDIHIKPTKPTFSIS